MPLPTNPEQETVARQLAEHRGVTVQGPPGTGKTHTIANLISHLVGHGKRVLVTSQKEQALSVLRGKIPESIRDLSVAVLGASAASITQLDQSVQAIYEHAVALNRFAARARIAELEFRLGELHREIGALWSRISASIARERDSYAIGAITHSPSTLGQWLAANAAELGYIPDGIQPPLARPLTGAEIADLYRLARLLNSADCEQARRHLPAAEQLASLSELANAVSELRDIRDRLATTESLVEDHVALESLGPDGLAAPVGAVERGARQLQQLEQPWLAAVRAELRTATFAASWRDPAEDVELCIIEARSRRRRYELIHRWNGAVGRVGGPLIDPTTAHPEYALDQHMTGIDDVFAREDRTRDALHDRLRASGVRTPAQLAPTDLTVIADMAAYLQMPPNMVRTHLHNLMGKLGVHSALEALALTRAQVSDRFQVSHQ